MTKRQLLISTKSTKVEKLYAVLSDGQWHSTKELARRVGHTFHVAKFKLVHYGNQIEKEKHPTKKWQYRYRLLHTT